MDLLDNIKIPITNKKINKIIEDVSENQLDITNPDVIELDKSNKLSNVYVINNEYFVKIITRRHVEIHRILTILWNNSLITIDNSRFFKSFKNPSEMIQHESKMCKKLHNVGIKTPKVIHFSEYYNCGVIVSEYLENPKQFKEIKNNNASKFVKQLFENLKRMQDNNIPHGDLQQDNVLISDGELYIIDVNNIDETNDSYKYYDIASAIATSSINMSEEDVISIAKNIFSHENIIKSKKFLDVITLQLGHDANSRQLKNEIEKQLQC